MSTPLTLTLKTDEGIPADSLEAVIPDEVMGEPALIRLCEDEKTVFTGVVDEYTRIVDRHGVKAAVSARSMAAYLLDNEAMPQNYDHPSAALIYERHVKSYGILVGDIDDTPLLGELTVTKGMSEWGVVRSFCMACYSCEPWLSSDGRLYMRGLPHSGRAVFTDNRGGIGYTALRSSIRRCTEISTVQVKVSNSQGYTLPVCNTEATDRGIVRRRYINAVLTSSPMHCADVMIENGRAASQDIRLECPGRHLGLLGRDAQVNSSIMGERGGLYVSGLRYSLTNGSEVTTVTLKRRWI